MKYRFAKSEERMRHLFEGGFSARDIASALASFDGELPAETARSVMERERYHVAGVRRAGRIAGFVELADLGSGTCGERCHPFSESSVVNDTASFSEVLAALEDGERVFVNVFGEVGGLITRSDIEKPPMRMWLFGFVTLIEMRLTRLVESRFPDESWTPLLSEQRLDFARRIQDERRRRGQEVRLLDCLQLADVAKILLGSPKTRDLLGQPSRTKAREIFKLLESLRNNLAHANEIVTHDWVTVVAIANELESTLNWLNRLRSEDGLRSVG